jgi:hypothetical protein
MVLKEIPLERKYTTLRAYDSGEIVITARLAKTMELQEGQGVKMVYSDNPTSRELYLTKCHTGIETRRRRADYNSSALRAYSTIYTKMLLKGAKRGIFRIGETIQCEGKDYFTIIYKKNYAK